MRGPTRGHSRQATTTATTTPETRLKGDRFVRLRSNQQVLPVAIGRFDALLEGAHEAVHRHDILGDFRIVDLEQEALLVHRRIQLLRDAVTGSPDLDKLPQRHVRSRRQRWQHARRRSLHTLGTRQPGATATASDAGDEGHGCGRARPCLCIKTLLLRLARHALAQVLLVLLALRVCQVRALVAVQRQAQLALVRTKMVSHEVRILPARVAAVSAHATCGACVVLASPPPPPASWRPGADGRAREREGVTCGRRRRTFEMSMVSSAIWRSRSRRATLLSDALATPPVPVLPPGLFWKSIVPRGRATHEASACATTTTMTATAAAVAQAAPRWARGDEARPQREGGKEDVHVAGVGEREREKDGCTSRMESARARVRVCASGRRRMFGIATVHCSLPGAQCRHRPPGRHPHQHQHHQHHRQCHCHRSTASSVSCAAAADDAHHTHFASSRPLLPPPPKLTRTTTRTTTTTAAAGDCCSCRPTRLPFATGSETTATATANSVVGAAPCTAMAPRRHPTTSAPREPDARATAADGTQAGAAIDGRFAGAASDPRFRPLRRARHTTVAIDNRFKHMFTDRRFQSDYSVDRHGRPVERSSIDSLRRFYRLADDDAGAAGDVTERSPMRPNRKHDESDRPVVRERHRHATVATAAVSDHPATEEEGSASGDADEAGDAENLEVTATRRVDYARGEGLLESSSSSSEEEGEEEGDASDSASDIDATSNHAGAKGSTAAADDQPDVFDEAWTLWHGGDAPAAEPSLQSTARRLAICNMDWNMVRAVDLLALLRSFAPANGAVFRFVQMPFGVARRPVALIDRFTCAARVPLLHMKPPGDRSVSVYPSEFGLQRMPEEEVHGPRLDNAAGFSATAAADAHDTRAASADDEEQLGAETRSDGTRPEQDDQLTTAMRRYELQRMRYYFAVAECDSAATANAIYEKCDGLELEHSSNLLDLRLIPDDMTFDEHEPRDVADGVPSTFEPHVFFTRALQHSAVEMTWDAADADRSMKLRRRFQAVRAPSCLPLTFLHTGCARPAAPSAADRCFPRSPSSCARHM